MPCLKKQPNISGFTTPYCIVDKKPAIPAIVAERLKAISFSEYV